MFDKDLLQQFSFNNHGDDFESSITCYIILQFNFNDQNNYINKQSKQRIKQF